MSNFKLGGHVSVNNRKAFVSEIVSDDSVKVTFENGMMEVVSVSEVVKRRGCPKRVEAPTKTVCEDGRVEYRLPNGLLHCEDGPAVIENDGYQAYLINGKLHRKDGPATIWPGGSVEYWQNDNLHREDGPAIIKADGYQAYWVNGKRHRTDGPAVIGANGYQAYWVDGREYMKEEFEALST